MRGQMLRQTLSGTMPAPTISQWGAVLMFLLLAAAGATFLLRRIKIEASTNQAGTLSPYPAILDARLLGKTTLFVETLVSLVLAALRPVVTSSDVMGALASGVVLAFIIHLFIVNARR